jgi:phospholipid transport system substrate-binding protein
VESNVNKVLAILRDPKLRGEAAREIKKAKLRAVYEVMFDDVELSRRTLARNWNKFNAEERKEFVLLFRQVLEKAYIDKILAYNNEKIVFEREISLADNQAEVQSRILAAGKEIPVYYRVLRKNDIWKVYDVIIENVSLVQNYRTQFAGILTKESPAQLIETLRKKVKGS